MSSVCLSCAAPGPPNARGGNAGGSRSRLRSWSSAYAARSKLAPGRYAEFYEELRTVSLAQTQQPPPSGLEACEGEGEGEGEDEGVAMRETLSACGDTRNAEETDL
jgi:hypothetical protein